MGTKFRTRVRRAILHILNETSTLRGLVVAVIVISGWQFSPERQEAYLTLALLAGSILKILLPDTWKDK